MRNWVMGVVIRPTDYFIRGLAQEDTHVVFGVLNHYEAYFIVSMLLASTIVE